MQHLIGKPIFVAVILLVFLISTSCNSFRDPSPVGDVEIESQSVPQATSTNTPEPIPTPRPTFTAIPEPTGTTELRTELVEPISPVSPVTTTEESVMTATHDSTQSIPGSEQILAAAIADLSEQTGTPSDQIKLVSMETVEWSDTSLGCPQEGFMYAQVITPGYLLILEVQGQQYTYHTDQNTNIILCQE
jgi:hypothetical protein